jgi:gamma-glutamyltranspeptidase / glutathione hydrolase
MTPRASLTLALGCLTTLALAADPPWLARSSRGMVASDAPAASRLGADVLAAGGNAFDAAIATSLGLSVARPQSTGLGGGGFLVAYVARDRRFVVLDFRETAPAGATAERYARLARAAGDGPAPSIFGGNAVGVPGLLAGLAEIHRRFGSQPWPELVRPAADLAQRGFTVDDAYRGAAEEALREFKKWPEFKERSATLYATLLGSGTPPPAGARLPRPDLARALRLIADQGAAAIYHGTLGQAIAQAAQGAGGVLTPDDLAGYTVKPREPLHVSYGDFEIVTMPPPSSGGVCVAETLNILTACRQRSDLDPQRDGTHVLVEALKHAFADRARNMGDPDFATLPLARLLDPRAAAEMARTVSPAHPLARDAYGAASQPASAPIEDRGTSHFCVADRDGNVVALTETVNGVFGSYVIAEPFGIVLNNQMDDFTTNPGQPNLFGLIQGAANVVAPGKRPLSSMTPTIVCRAGKPVLALGASGGPRIITAVLQVLLNVIERGQPLEQAIDAVRLHHQWLPDEVYFDRAAPDALIADLRAHGQTVSTERRSACVQALQILADGTFVGASDPRKGGQPAGVE